MDNCKLKVDKYRIQERLLGRHPLAKRWRASNPRRVGLNEIVDGKSMKGEPTSPFWSRGSGGYEMPFDHGGLGGAWKLP